MSDSEESAVVSLSTRQWTLLEEHLDFHILNDFLGNELPSRKSDETEDGHRQQMRKLQVDQLKRVVNNDSTKLSLLRTAISSRQPDLAGSMNLDSAPTDSSSESSREQGKTESFGYTIKCSCIIESPVLASRVCLNFD